MDIEIDKVSHAYGPLRVLQDVSFRVQGGHIVVVLGPSGCGKTTLLRIVGGLERPSGGEVRTRGDPPADSINPVTYMFQDRALAPWMTVAENVAFPLRRRGVSARERRTATMSGLSRVGLTEFAHMYPNALSGGMQQRVAFARALVVRPCALLMDEPLSALDESSRSALVGSFLKLWTEIRFSAIYVTHSVAEAAMLGHRVIILSNQPGRVQEIVELDGSPGFRSTANLRDMSDHLRNLVDLPRSDDTRLSESSHG